MGYQHAWPRIRDLFPRRRTRTPSPTRASARQPEAKRVLVPVLGGPEEGGVSWVELGTDGSRKGASRLDRGS